jgi:hypothetical protein
MGLSSSVAFGATFSAGEGWVLTVRHGYRPKTRSSQATATYFKTQKDPPSTESGSFLFI